MFLAFKCFAELLPTILAQCNGLVATSRLYVFLAKHVPCLVQMLHIRLESGAHIIDLLVHKAHLQINARDLRMILANRCLHNLECSVQVFETLGEVSTVMVVHGQISVAEAYRRMIDSEKSLLQDDCLSLKLDSL